MASNPSASEAALAAPRKCSMRRQRRLRSIGMDTLKGLSALPASNGVEPDRRRRATRRWTYGRSVATGSRQPQAGVFASFLNYATCTSCSALSWLPIRVSFSRHQVAERAPRTRASQARFMPYENHGLSRRGPPGRHLDIDSSAAIRSWPINCLFYTRNFKKETPMVTAASQPPSTRHPLVASRL